MAIKGVPSHKAERMRNIVMGKYTTKTKIQTGYNAIRQNTPRIEGDVWDEAGKQWTIKNGIKKTVTKLSKARSIIQRPVSCPKCTGSMNDQISKYYWNVLQMCGSCVSKFHTKLKIDGKWDEYVNQTRKDNLDFWLSEIKDEYSEWLDTSAKSYISEAGHVEKWANKQSNLTDFEDKLKNMETE